MSRLADNAVTLLQMVTPVQASRTTVSETPSLAVGTSVLLSGAAGAALLPAGTAIVLLFVSSDRLLSRYENASRTSASN